MKLEDLEDVRAEADRIRKESFAEMAKAFKGIRVIVDDRLEGLDYYCCISRELFEELRKKGGDAQ